MKMVLLGLKLLLKIELLDDEKKKYISTLTLKYQTGNHFEIFFFTGQINWTQDSPFFKQKK